MVTAETPPGASAGHGLDALLDHLDGRFEP